jgi:hypothetical protein
MQNPAHLLVLEPACFGGNSETAVNNHFQKTIGTSDKIQSKALDEHQVYVAGLQSAGIQVTVLKDDLSLKNTDAVFLNNWFCILPNKTLILFPMWAKSRRNEIREDLVAQLQREFQVVRTLDYRYLVDDNLFCEGTGSIIFDHEKKYAFAAISPRTSPAALEKICSDIGYTAISFEANDLRGQEIYHTNVLLAIGKHVVVICADAIVNPIERSMVLKYLSHSGKLMISISLQQMEQFCGNVFEVDSNSGATYLCMSSTAFNGFTKEQISLMGQRAKLFHTPIPVIEQAGGGSVRCMMAAAY